MKKIGLIVLLSLCVVGARAAEKEVKLLGVGTGSGAHFAIMSIRGNRNVAQVEILKEGQATEGVEVARIEAAKGTVTAFVDGAERQLSLPEDAPGGSTNELNASLPLMDFHAVPLQAAVSLYADYSKRTVLMHPQLGNPTISVRANAQTEAEAAAVLEKLFAEKNVAAIPDGKHFVMLVPFALTNSVTPRSTSLPETNSPVPTMSVVFRTAPIHLVLQTYADFVHKEIVNLHDNSWLKSGYPPPVITFVQTTPLSREEIAYALETLIEWHDIRMTPAGDNKLKLELVNNR